ncbi:Carbohydrate binding module 27 [Clostridium sp. DSM 8431]|uniref:CIA30 family protein n=1 Tax=Clostridium sp. DSM 8431 TaxID=1761781 RepID=UPI0008EFEF8B|nr:CIA30 family protein [Clostridium sp. DSM 8431]SFU45553.1 Carbohydrate binding module 27 [Clostridium sp. DSM 8431]
MKRKHIALLLACSMVLGFTPQASIGAKAATNDNVVFLNDFEASKLPDEVSGVLKSSDVAIKSLGDNKALKIASKFDGTDDWDNNKHEIAFTTSNQDLVKGSKVEYDIIIPTANKNFNGLMKSAGGFTTHDTSTDEWGWASLDCGDIKSTAFSDMGDGYSKVHVSTTLTEDVKGACKLDIQIDAYECTYAGDMYLDNVKISKPASSENKSKDTIIFENDLETSKLPDEVSGVLKSTDVTAASLEEDNTALKIKSKFDGTDSWEDNIHQISYKTNYTKDLSKDAKIEYDIIIPTANKSFTGQMKGAGGVTTHDESTDEWGWVNFNVQDITSSDFVDMGNGYSKVHVAQTMEGEVKGLFKIDLQIVAWECTYSGDFYVDNIKYSEPGKETPGEGSVVTDKNIYYSDFEANQMPNTVTGVISASDLSIEKVNDSNALKVPTKFDGTDDWENNNHQMVFDAKSDDDVTKDAKLEFDLLIPTKNKNFDGQMKIAGGFTTFDGDNWAWVNNSMADIKSSDFTDLGNGYSLKHVVVNPSDVVKGMQNINLQIDAYECTYKGDIYIDNLRLHESKTSEAEVATGLIWDFNDASKGLDGWKYDSDYDYHGTHDVSYDTSFTGSGSLKFDLDFTKDSSAGWSEVKLSNWVSDGINMGEYNTIKFNLYYNPANMTKGSFKSQFWINSDINKSTDIDFAKSEYLGNGVSKVPVSMTFDSKDVKANNVILTLVGSSTDYKGAMYIDDINLCNTKVKDIYVNKTVEATSNPTKVDISSLQTPSSVQLVDSKATDSTASLLAYLKGIGQSKYAIFGHQDPTTYKAGTMPNGATSDVEDLTGSLPGVCGIDGLSFTGAELQLKPGDTRDLVTATADVCKEEAAKGSILTLSVHMPNFARVAEKGKKNGKYDYSGYTVADMEGNVAERILPGGDLNEVYNGYLDMVADFGHQMDEVDVPILFRPLHECNGSWFWWGKGACDDDTYKSLFAYTVEYLRDTKNVHNFLYVFSPNGPFIDENDYLQRYPGDAFVDIMGIDQYHNNPKGGPEIDGWFKSLKDSIAIVDAAAEKHGKLSTVSETGIATTKGSLYEQNGATAVSGNLDKDWYQHVAEIVSESNMPFYMVWANFAKDNFYVPYMVDETKGHEMVDNFINYYNDENSVFANGVGDYREVKVNKGDAFSYAYIESPAPGSRVLNPATIKAKVSADSTDIKFNVKAGDELVATLDAKLNEASGLYEADIDEALLNKIGKKVGSIEVTIDGEVKTSAKYTFNIPVPEIKNDVVDDFEAYGDEDSLLQGAWGTNCGAGCSLTPTLVKDEDGNHKMKFNYKISTEVLEEGYAGMLNTKKCDWSAYDALQIYIKPDGNAQKLVVQITCNGEDFEVHLPEFAGTTEGTTLVIPFSEFKGKQNGTFDPANITSFGLWCNTIVPEGHTGAWTVDSSFEFDNIKAVKQSEVNTGAEDLEKAVKAVEKAENSKTQADITEAEKLIAKLESGKDKTDLEARIKVVKDSLVDTNTVTVKDANLKSAICKLLNKSVTDTLTKADMAKVKNLDAKNLGITSLEGLEYATNLRDLDVTGNSITDVTPITSLMSLKYLSLDNNSVTDAMLNTLSSMTSLLSLSVTGTKVTNIDPVAKLVNLKYLYISNTDVSDLTPVKGLSELRYLYLCNTKVKDIAPVYSCQKLMILGISGNGMNYNIWGLKSQLPNLKSVVND